LIEQIIKEAGAEIMPAECGLRLHSFKKAKPRRGNIEIYKITGFIGKPYEKMDAHQNVEE
jgi:hypothetical protein